MNTCALTWLGPAVWNEACLEWNQYDYHRLDQNKIFSILACSLGFGVCPADVGKTFSISVCVNVWRHDGNFILVCITAVKAVGGRTASLEHSLPSVRVVIIWKLCFQRQTLPGFLRHFAMRQDGGFCGDTGMSNSSGKNSSTSLIRLTCYMRCGNLSRCPWWWVCSILPQVCITTAQSLYYHSTKSVLPQHKVCITTAQSLYYYSIRFVLPLHKVCITTAQGL